MKQTSIDALLTHVRIRRAVLFRLYYSPKKPLPTMANGHTIDPKSAVWGELLGIDNHVLGPAADAELIPKNWQAQVPVSSTDNGGFDSEYLQEYLA